MHSALTSNIRLGLKDLPGMNTLLIRPGSTVTNGREPGSCLGQVFNFKLGSFLITPKMLSLQMAKSKAENLARVSSC